MNFYWINYKSNAIKGEKFISEFSEIFPINGTFYNGNIGENNQFILDFPKIFPLNGVPFNGVRLYRDKNRKLRLILIELTVYLRL